MDGSHEEKRPKAKCGESSRLSVSSALTSDFVVFSGRRKSARASLSM